MLFFVVIEELNVQENMNFDNGISRPKLKTTWAKQAEVIKEPYMCSPLQNLLLYFPGLAFLSMVSVSSAQFLIMVSIYLITQVPLYIYIYIYIYIKVGKGENLFDLRPK
jgi:hypothetical protein